MQIVLSFVQGQARYLVWLTWQQTGPTPVKNFVYFGFVFGFATIRLWVTLAILTFALREAYLPRTRPQARRCCRYWPSLHRKLAKFSNIPDPSH